MNKSVLQTLRLLVQDFGAEDVALALADVVEESELSARHRLLAMRIREATQISSETIGIAILGEEIDTFVLSVPKEVLRDTLGISEEELAMRAQQLRDQLKKQYDEKIDRMMLGDWKL